MAEGLPHLRGSAVLTRRQNRKEQTVASLYLPQASSQDDPVVTDREGGIVNRHIAQWGDLFRTRPARVTRLLLIAVLAIGTLLAPIAARADTIYPSSMASTGDSITRAYNTGTFPYSDNPSGSWSTGTNATVASHYSRLLLLNSSISGKNYNDAKSGAKMVDLDGQLTTVASRHVDYVTVLMGGKDVCTSSPATMTSVDAFTAQFRTAMDNFAARSPTTRVYVVSIPSVQRLWSVLKGSGSARFIWSIFGVCQSMLKNPLSTAMSDVQRRQAVDERERAFNSALQTVCAAHVPQCSFDANAVFSYAFTASDISTRDYFHPSLTGQKNIAAVSWSAGPYGP
jgi:lysophospholipase L1-like esterase